MPDTVAPVPRTLPGVPKMALLGSLGLDITRVCVPSSERSRVSALESTEGEEVVGPCLVGFRRGRLGWGRDARDLLQRHRHQVAASSTTTKRQIRSTMRPTGVFDAAVVDRRYMATGLELRLGSLAPWLVVGGR